MSRKRYQNEKNPQVLKDRWNSVCVADGLAAVRVSPEEPCWQNLITASNDLRAIESLRAQALKSPVQRLVVSFTNRKTEGVKLGGDALQAPKTFSTCTS